MLQLELPRGHISIFVLCCHFYNPFPLVLLELLVGTPGPFPSPYLKFWKHPILYGQNPNETSNLCCGFN